MELLKFSMQHFRNLREQEMIPASGMNVILGENAQGKTNLLEAIFVLSTLKSFRTRLLPETLQFGESQALLHGSIQSEQAKHGLSVCVREAERVAMLDRKKADPLHYLGTFNVFLFSYPLLEVIRGGPEERRKFLDRSIAMTRTGYLSELLQYHRAMKQKNALLFSLQRGQINRKEGIDEIRSFNQQLMKHGREIVRQRSDYLDQLQKILRRKQELFFDADQILAAELRSSFLSSDTEMERALERTLEREIARGICLLGVHRDEVRLSINGRELRKFGSSGQQRAFLLLLVLAQLELYERWRQDRPVLLLDDLDSELDSRRIRAFLELIRGQYQTFISTSRQDLFTVRDGLRLFKIESGKLLER